jgi:L-serine dehydratase
MMLQTFSDLLQLCQQESLSIGQAALKYEVARGEKDEAAVLASVRMMLDQMKATIQSGLYSDEKSMSGLSGGFSHKVMTFFEQSDKKFMSPVEHKMMAYALATMEENSRMKKIVACPTAGASGVVPAVLIALQEEKHLSDQTMELALLAAGLVGELVSRRMYLSGAAAGCQAEVGVATGMSAAGIVDAMGGTPQQGLDATAIAFKNMMGLVCDPVAGLVEVPCVKRNSVAGIHASAAATLAMADIYSFIPLDEVVEAMVKVGQLMHPSLKESAEGGLAATPTAVAFTKNLFHQGSS